MTKTEYEEEIIKLMKMYYRNEEKARAWYKKPNRLIYGYNRPFTPEQLVNDGQGALVIRFIKLFIGG